MLKSSESISHGDICDISWDLVLLAESLELLSGEAVEIHFNHQKDSKQAVLKFSREITI